MWGVSPHTFCRAFRVAKNLMGRLDVVSRDMVHQDIKKTSVKQLLRHGNLGWADAVQPKLDSEGTGLGPFRLSKSAKLDLRI